MKSFIVAACVALFATCLLPASARADGLANPVFDSWTNCAVGSSATYQQSSDAAGHKIVTDIIDTLSEKAADHVTVDSTTTATIDGNALPAQTDKKTVPAKLDKQPDQKKLPNEQIEVGGKKLDCTVVEMDIADTKGGQTTIKIWTDADVPGSLVKMEAKSSVGAIAMRLKSYDKK